MGNFYANHAVATGDTHAVADALDSRGRRAYVAGTSGITFVYDERCDAQDLDELRRVAELLSRDCGAPVLAACNHDDDVLWLALAEDGRVVDVYESRPGYFEGEDVPPRIANVKRLCLAFGVASAAAEVERLLAKSHATFIVEVDRHRALLRALGIESDAGLFGYRYVSQGELTGVADIEELHSVGGAAAAPSGRPSAESIRPDSEAPGGRGDIGSPELAREIRHAAAALSLSEIDLPDGFEAVFGSGRVNGFIAFSRFQRYVAEHSVVDAVAPGGPAFRFDALVARLLRVDGSAMAGLVPAFMTRLRVWEPLSPDVRADIEADAPDIQARMAEALREHVRELSE
jgi:hypothetical protein